MLIPVYVLNKVLDLRVFTHVVVNEGVRICDCGDPVDFFFFY